MGRILGLDFGLRRVGAAVSDPGRTIASPLEVYERRDADSGCPPLPASSCASTRSSGSSSACRFTPAAERESWRRWPGNGAPGWARSPGFPSSFTDERYTSVEADNLMIGSGLKRQKRKALRDKLAAQILLQGYLDAGCPGENLSPGPSPTRKRPIREHAHRRLWVPGGAGCDFAAPSRRVRLRNGPLEPARRGDSPARDRAEARRRAQARNARRLPRGRPGALLRRLRPNERDGHAYGLRPGPGERPGAPAGFRDPPGLRQLDQRLRPERGRVGRRGLSDGAGPEGGQDLPGGGGSCPPWADDRHVSAVVLRFSGLYGADG